MRYICCVGSGDGGCLALSYKRLVDDSIHVVVSFLEQLAGSQCY
jgi:hypothetical protein